MVDDSKLLATLLEQPGAPATQPVADKLQAIAGDDGYAGVLPTYAGDTMLRIPVPEGREDAAILKEISFKVAEIFRAGDDKTGADRNQFIKNALKEYEASWA